MKLFFLLIGCCTLLAEPSLRLVESADVRAALDHISPDSLRGNLSFIASDALEGRNTPSRGLDIAAEFIASQFRRAGLEAPIDGDYFQYADFFHVTRRADGVSLVIANGDQTANAGPADFSIGRSNSEINLDSVPIYKLAGNAVTDEVTGKAVVLRRGGTSLMRPLREKKAALIITLGSGGAGRSGERPTR